jgi:hypothetical protein
MNIGRSERLGDAEASAGLLEQNQSSLKHSQTVSGIGSYLRVYICLLHIFVCAFVGITLSRGSPRASTEIQQLLSWSPLQDFIEYEARNTDVRGMPEHRRYGGTPTDEQNRAWDQLMER